MAQNDFAAQLGKAYALQHKGDFAGALNEFKQILNQDGSNIDALFGGGIAHRKLGDIAAAREMLLKAQKLIAEGLANNPGADRYEMMTRIVEQRLHELG